MITFTRCDDVCWWYRTLTSTTRTRTTTMMDAMMKMIRTTTATAMTLELSIVALTSRQVPPAATSYSTAPGIPLPEEDPPSSSKTPSPAVAYITILHSLYFRCCLCIHVRLFFSIPWTKRVIRTVNPLQSVRKFPPFYSSVSYTHILGLTVSYILWIALVHWLFKIGLLRLVQQR